MPKYTFAKPYYNVADVGNTVACVEAWNVYYEPMPGGGFAIRRRPGLTSLAAAKGAKGYGVYWSDRQSALYHVQDSTVYKTPAKNAEPVTLGSVTAGYPAVFAEGQQSDTLQNLLYVATGGRLKYVDLVADTVNQPATVDFDSTFVAMMNNRMIANDLAQDQWVHYTGFNPDTGADDMTYWGFLPEVAALSPDPLRGIFTTWNEIYLWGTRVCELWQDDGVTPLSALVGANIEAG